MKYTISSKYNEGDKVIFNIKDDDSRIITYGKINNIKLLEDNSLNRLYYTFEYEIIISFDEFDRITNGNRDNQQRLLGRYHNGQKAIVPIIGNNNLMSDIVIKFVEENYILTKII